MSQGIVVIILSLFRIIEGWLPSEFYAHHIPRLGHDQPLDVKALPNGFSLANRSTRLSGCGSKFEYRMVIRSQIRSGSEKWSNELLAMPDVVEFRISPSCDQAAARQSPQPHSSINENKHENSGL